jgi:hypothetical protein
MVADTLILIAFAISVYIWQREQSKLSFYTFVFFVVLVLFATWEYFAQNVLHLTGSAASISSEVSLVFWIVAGITLIALLTKFFTRR